MYSLQSRCSVVIDILYTRTCAPPPSFSICAKPEHHGHSDEYTKPHCYEFGLANFDSDSICNYDEFCFYECHIFGHRNAVIVIERRCVLIPQLALLASAVDLEHAAEATHPHPQTSLLPALHYHTQELRPLTRLPRL